MKTMSKHTPGPWRHTESDRGRAGVAHFIEGADSDENGALCQAFGACRAPETLLANIRLLAAAPTMYGLLREIKGYLSCVGTDENNDTCGVTFTCGACRRAKEIEAVLAKAEGRGDK